MAALFLEVRGRRRRQRPPAEARGAVRAQEVYAAVRHVVAARSRAPWLRTTDDRPMRTFTSLLA
jgi:hypothetical protein